MKFEAGMAVCNGYCSRFCNCRSFASQQLSTLENFLRGAPGRAPCPESTARAGLVSALSEIISLRAENARVATILSCGDSRRPHQLLSPDHKLLKRFGERGRNRTFNLLIKSQLLCQLSYAPFARE